VPTRNRPRNIKHLIVNIDETIRDLTNIELLVAFDTDDSMTLRELSGIPTKDRPYHFFPRERSEWLNKDYYNWLASKANGNYLWGIGDDVRFLTKDWDIILSDKIEKYLQSKSDRIAYISVNEQGSTAKHPCFPLITKEAFKVLGEYHSSRLMSWGSDRILYEIYSNPLVGRILHIPEISIQHLTYHDGTASYDETAKSMHERFFRDPNCHNYVSMYIVPQQIKILSSYIKEFHSNGMVKQEQIL
jgi:hypothetical protein